MRSLILFFFILVSNVHAFTLITPGRANLPGPKVMIKVASNSCVNAGYDSAEAYAEAIQEAMDEYWNRIPTCKLELEVSGVDSSINAAALNLDQLGALGNDGEIIAGCSNDAGVFSADSIVGRGGIYTDGSRGVLLINNLHSTFGELSAQEKLATIAHEIGHAFGLGHSGDPAALMYYAVGGKIQDRLSIDDYDGCSWLYNHESPGSCSAVPILPRGGHGDGNHDNGASGSSGGPSGPGKNFFFTLVFGLGLSVFAWKKVSTLS